MFNDPMVEPDETEGAPARKGVGLCMSGGGYRAMLFHVGSLWRLHEAGVLPKIDRFSAVSGGSIAMGQLAVNWQQLQQTNDFSRYIVEPLVGLAKRTIDIPSILKGLFWLGTAPDYTAQAYRKHLYGNKTLQDIPEWPRFTFCATNVQSLALWRFTRSYMGDWRVGLAPKPSVEVAVAAAASSAFPPILSPLILSLHRWPLTVLKGADLHRPPYLAHAHLSDGGVYDNMGIEPIWKRCETVLVSDAGGKMSPSEKPRRDWLFHGLQTVLMGDNQVRNLRKRQVLSSYRTPVDEDGHREGTYWSVRSHVVDYHLADPMEVGQDAADQLSLVPTRLAKLEDSTIESLINWGYAITDTAIRKWIDPTIPKGIYPFARGV